MKNDGKKRFVALAEKIEPSDGLKPIAIRIPVAVKMTGIGRTRLYELIRDKEIETVKLGTSTLVLVDSLRNFIEGLREPR